MGALHAHERAGCRHLHDRRRCPDDGSGAGLDYAPEEHGDRQRRQVHRGQSLEHGGGAQIADAVNKALSEIQAVNGVFASVSLAGEREHAGHLSQPGVRRHVPPSTRTRSLAGPVTSSNTSSACSAPTCACGPGEASKGAINSLTGFITEAARSFLDAGHARQLLGRSAAGGCIPPAGSAADLYRNSNFLDGNIVEKGAQGYLAAARRPAR